MNSRVLEKNKLVKDAQYSISQVIEFAELARVNEGILDKLNEIKSIALCIYSNDTLEDITEKIKIHLDNTIKYIASYHLH